MAWAVLLLLCGVSGYRTEAGIYEVGIGDVDQWHQEFIDTLRMVQIYAPFMMRSKDFSPVYASVSRTLKTLSLPVTLGKVDLSKEENKPLLDRYKASDVPHLCFFRAGSTEAFPYAGEMTPESIIPFLKKHIFHIEALTEVEDYERMATDENPIHGLLLAVVESKESDLARIFTQYAKENAGKFVFALVEDKGEFAARFDLNSEAVIVSRPVALLGKDDLAFRNITKAVSLKHFAKQLERMFPTPVSLWTHYTEDLLLARQLPIVTLYFDLDGKHNLPRVKYMANRLRRGAEKFFFFNEDDNKFIFTIADRREYKKEIDRLQLTNNRVFLAMKTKEGQLYVMKETQLMVDEQKIKTEAITKFVEAYLAGKLEMYVRSEEKPEEEVDRHVHTVVGQTFNSVVMEDKKHTLLLVYSSTMPDASLHETYSHIGELLETRKDLTVAKIEASLNEIPSHCTSPIYPKLMFLPSTNKYNVISFEGETITTDSVLKFVTDNIEKAKNEEKKPEDAKEEPATQETKTDL